MFRKYIEQLDRPGVKLLASGGGRCNLTNTLRPDDFMARFGRQGRFIQPALKAMDAAKLRTFLGGLHVPTHSPDGLHVFPASDSALTVQKALTIQGGDGGTSATITGNVSVNGSINASGSIIDAGGNTSNHSH